MAFRKDVAKTEIIDMFYVDSVALWLRCFAALAGFLFRICS